MPGPEFAPVFDLALKKPLRIGDADVAVLHLREPTAGDLETADGTLGLIGQVAGIKDTKALGNLAASDFAKANDYLNSWSRSGQLIGLEDGLIDPEAVPESLVLVLEKALRNGEVTELDLVEPTAEQLASQRNVNWVTNNLLLLQLVTKTPIGVLRQMAARDFAKASEYLGFFTRPGQLTGKS